jgi:hypothetical protein
VLSGGVDLSNLPFSKYSGSILVATLPSDVCASSSCFNELFVNGRRSPRARYPNGNPETQGLWTVNHTGYVTPPAEGSWLPPNPPKSTGITIEDDTPHREHPTVDFVNYQIGIDGAAEVFSPPSSFWASGSPPGGVTFEVPSGFVADESSWTNRSYADPSTGLIHTFHGSYWGGWVFSVSDIDSSTRTVHFSRGGFQEARGSDHGAEWYLENVFEELDAPSEWFIDEEKSLLFFFPNNTLHEFEHREDGRYYFRHDQEFSSSESVSTLIGSQLPHILNVQGSSPTDLVEFITITGLTFAHTASDYMDAPEVPSGGDWSLLRQAAVRMAYISNATVSDCVFNGIGGNGIVISDTALSTNILSNEFVWVGSSAVLIVGTVAGIDGASVMSQPKDTIVRSNFFHEMGIWVKQSSAVLVALSYSTVIDSNICFNLARACVNLNDGFGGGAILSNNLLFNSIRETDDHGPINSWDRQVYLQQRSDGTDSIIQEESYITHNFIINNYHAVWPIDHDDGSQYFTDTRNFMVYGGSKNFLGNSVASENNYYVMADGLVNAVQEWQIEQKQSQLQSHRNSPSTPSKFSQLSGIMKRRARNLQKRYVLDSKRFALRDAALAAGLSLEDAIATMDQIPTSDSEHSPRQDSLQFIGGGTYNTENWIQWDVGMRHVISIMSCLALCGAVILFV